MRGLLGTGSESFVSGQSAPTIKMPKCATPNGDPYSGSFVFHVGTLPDCHDGFGNYQDVLKVHFCKFAPTNSGEYLDRRLFDWCR
jgi:hypothetical protein